LSTRKIIANLGVVSLIVVVVLGSVGGCNKSPKVTRVQDEAVFQEQNSPRSTGSLWDPDNGRAFMFEDRRASRVGDIVVVEIVEAHKGSKSASTSADRESTVGANIGGSLFGLNNFLPAFASGLEGDATLQNDFEGEGSTSREDTLTGTIAAKVVEVFPNGDLRIRGKREVTVNSEKQTMTIKGIVRRIDLDTENTVLSTKVADAEITYTGLGVVDDVQRPGWLTRILNWVTPF